MKCPSCSFDSPAGFKFCGACGTPFAQAAPDDGVRRPAPTPHATPAELAARADERRTVTILFADISGFTAMSEKLDPEAVQEIMDRAFERLTAVITGFGGTIDKYIGDAVMALFGAPVALGDDPERAVRAGLGMQKVMVEYAEELKRARGIGLAMRVGINTGKVIWGKVGGAGEKKFTVMGDAVNLASRLEHAAPIGGVLIGEATQRHVRTRFALEALDPIQVKGKAELQRVYRVIGEVSAPARATMIGPRSPFVGRDDEMSEFAGLFTALKDKKGNGSVVTLEASVGTGKSRMVLELRADAEDRNIATVSARAPAFGQGGPFAPWTDLFQRAAGLAGLPPVAARERLHGWLDERAPSSGVDPRWLEELAGEVDAADPEVQRRREQPARFREGLLDAVITWIWAFARHRPLVLFAEDLHWWPAPSLEILTGVAQVARKAPLVLIGTSRPEPKAIPWPPDPGDKVVHLSNLDDAALLTLAHGVLGGTEVPRGLLQRLYSVSGGNPFFAEEIIQAFIDRGALKTSPDRAGWVWDEVKAKAADLPTTVEGVTQARIDSLPPRERHVLQMAAVAGSTFWEGLLIAMGEPQAHPALLQLIARDLVHSRRSRLAGEKEYAFKHATIQAVAYENELRRERVNDHRRVAEWLETHAGEDSAEFAPIIADHFLRAEAKENALPYLLRAAEAEARVTRLDAAALVEKAVAVATEVGEERSLGWALRIRGKLRRVASHPDTESDLRKALEIGERTGDPIACAESARDLAGYLLRRGDLAGGEEFAEKTLLAARLGGKGAARCEVEALNMLGSVARRRGELDDAMLRYEAALTKGEELEDGPVVGTTLISIGNLHLTADRHREAIAAFDRALKKDVSLENAAILHCNLGAAHLSLNDSDAAVRELARALELAEKVGSKVIAAEALIRMGSCRIEVGQRAQGLEQIDAGLAIARESNIVEVVLEGLTRKANALSKEDPARALETLEEARVLASAKRDAAAVEKIDLARRQVSLTAGSGPY